MKVEPYLLFNGRCEEALDFYTRALDAEVTALMRYSDAPDPDVRPGVPRDKIMHANFRIGESLLMASDGECAGEPEFAGVSLSISPPDEAEAKRLFDALLEGGEVILPLGKTFWSPAFGMLKDRFGLSWMINVV